MAHGALYSAVGRLALPENWPRAPCTAALRGDTPTNAVDSFRPFGFRGAKFGDRDLSERSDGTHWEFSVKRRSVGTASLYRVGFHPRSRYLQTR